MVKQDKPRKSQYKVRPISVDEIVEALEGKVK